MNGGMINVRDRGLNCLMGEVLIRGNMFKGNRVGEGFIYGRMGKRMRVNSKME